MTGGGFGGCTVALVKREAVAEIKKRMAADYKLKTGINATILSHARQAERQWSNAAGET